MIEDMKSSWRLGAAACVSGFTLMAHELVAARLLAPSVGNSTYVWTGVIGVIIIALSAGCWLGGRIADYRHAPQDVGLLLIIAAVLVVATMLSANNTLRWLTTVLDEPRIQAVIAALALFAPASFVLGAVSPYLAKLNVSSLNTAGRSVANLSALDAVGGIAGTFVTGFVLLGMIGLNETLALITGILLATSWLFMPRWQWQLRALMVGTVIVAALSGLYTPKHGGVSIETPSAHYSIVNYTSNGRQIRGLVTGPTGVQSGVYLDGTKGLPFWYTRRMVEVTIAAKPRTVLLLGGGAFTMAEHMARQLPNTHIDVVEIDPGLENISRQYFSYQSLPNVKLIFDDARTYIQRTNRHYDVVLIDVYNGGEIPYSLLTAEYGSELARITREDGLVVANLIAGLNNAPCRELFAAFDAVYRRTWPYAWYGTQHRDLSRGNYV
jgi:predicted membrane-bound spermidine synthase